MLHEKKQNKKKLSMEIHLGNKPRSSLKVSLWIDTNQMLILMNGEFDPHFPILLNAFLFAKSISLE